ncbi:MAG: MBL fold metallo-hydrolase [Gammaproteobacteria bacterium]|nr:MAG: MBL fold metallo-hydrolase [Gammaproteobacteria bacterium]
MTGPGTNSYLVGDCQLALIDPGPAIPSHVEWLLSLCADRLQWILVTHTHPDHSPAAKIISEATGAQMIGCVMADDGHQDRTFEVKENLYHGQLLQTPEFTLEAIHTPGHVANQFCYLLRDEGMLFSGDHIMQGSSVVIIPPSGNMSDYIQSTEQLMHYPINVIAPGHGELLDNPAAVLDQIVSHRMERERKVVQALRQLGESGIDALLEHVYNDVRSDLLAMAKLSLWAHLLKLEEDGVALKRIAEHWAFGEERWVLAP